MRVGVPLITTTEDSQLMYKSRISTEPVADNIPVPIITFTVKTWWRIIPKLLNN
jgi:hypothetical protein